MTLAKHGSLTDLTVHKILIYMMLHLLQGGRDSNPRYFGSEGNAQSSATEAEALPRRYDANRRYWEKWAAILGAGVRPMVSCSVATVILGF